MLASSRLFASRQVLSTSVRQLRPMFVASPILSSNHAHAKNNNSYSHGHGSNITHIINLNAAPARAAHSKAASFAATDPMDLVRSELKGLAGSIKELITSEHPVLSKVAKYFFENSGKRFRPMVVLLMARAVNAISAAPQQGSTAANTTQQRIQSIHHANSNSSARVPQGAADLNPPLFSVSEQAGSSGAVADDTVLSTQRRLAQITELIHTASLLHDDVIDLAETRRAIPAAHIAFGNKVAVLGGDFLLAKSSIYTARLGSLPVVELLSNVIEDLVEGEFLQSSPASRTDEGALDFERYFRKTYLKTGSLLANSCKAAALLGGHEGEVAEAAFAYGKNLGMCFQLIDDLLDYTSTEGHLGKPVGHDLDLGLITAPVIFASKSFPEVRELVKREFSNVGDKPRVLTLVKQSKGLQQTQDLAAQYADAAKKALLALPDTAARQALLMTADELVGKGAQSIETSRL